MSHGKNGKSNDKLRSYTKNAPNLLKDVDDSAKKLNIDNSESIIVFSFENMVKEYSIERCDEKIEKSLGLEALARAGNTTWELAGLTRKQCAGGVEAIRRSDINIDKSVNNISDDITVWHILRFHGKKGRFIGYRTGNVFHITHFDPYQKAYGHGK